MYTTIKEEVSSELIEKKSRFIANLFYVETREQAENKIKELKKKYFDARHNCSAYIVLNNDSIIEKTSDDGEPSGTAGVPMLNILKKNELCNILVVVTRYFGGVLLGTGGLVRAYSEVTANSIQKAEKIKFCYGKEYEVTLNYEDLENFKYYCKKSNIKIIKIQYLNEIICNIDIKNEDIDRFLEDIENGKIILRQKLEKNSKKVLQFI